MAYNKYDDNHEASEMAAGDLWRQKNILQQAKEIVLDLWMKGRVDMYVRSEADIALSAAIFALDTPDCGKVTKRMGAIANNAQWKAEQEAKNREF